MADYGQQDDKLEVKKEGDVDIVEMKTDEPPSTMEPASSTMHEDISPISRSISNIADDDKPSISKSTWKYKQLFEFLRRILLGRSRYVTFCRLVSTCLLIMHIPPD
jgi:hypothetical protein